MEIAEKKRRRRERITVVILLLLLGLLAGFEIHVLKLSAKLPFMNSVFFFGLMNLNIVLIMLLLFLVFRNGVKLILDERRGKPGSRLRSRLVFSFLLFSIIPTVLLFAISAMYIKSSFDKWFSAKVESTLQRSIEVVKIYYENTERNAQHFARRIATAIETHPKSNIGRELEQFRLEYGVDALEYYADPFSARIISTQPDKVENIPSGSLETLKEVFSGRQGCRIQNVGTGELVRCGVHLGAGNGALFVDYFIPTSLASQLSEISMTYDDFKRNNPLDYPLKSTYFAILIMVTLLILFSAIWTGFYIAKRLTVPIEELLQGTEAVARGDLEFRLTPGGQGELAKLVESFNQMVHDLRQNKIELDTSHSYLKRMNEELVTRRRYIEVLLENLQSGVISLDDQGKISMVNAAAGRLLTIDPSELIQKPYWTIIPEQYRREIRESLANIAVTGQSERKEIRFQARGNRWVTLLVTLSAFRDENRQQNGIVAVIDDVTEMQKIERMSAWREVARRIAHEIKNPLTPIQLSVERLRRRYLDKIRDDGTFDQSTQIILSEVDSLKRLVAEFTTFARLPEIVQTSEELNSILTESANFFRAAHESVRFELDLVDTLPLLRLDRAQFKRALVNLFDNAVSAMSGDGTITVKSFCDSDLKLFCVSVSDTGCGIDDFAQRQLFEPYFSTKEGGTGLGLAIVQRIVSDHGGYVRVRKNHPVGTCFTIELPWNLQANLHPANLQAQLHPDKLHPMERAFDPKPVQASMESIEGNPI